MYLFVLYFGVWFDDFRTKNALDNITSALTEKCINVFAPISTISTTPVSANSIHVIEYPGAITDNSLTSRPDKHVARTCSGIDKCANPFERLTNPGPIFLPRCNEISVLTYLCIEYF